MVVIPLGTLRKIHNLMEKYLLKKSFFFFLKYILILNPLSILSRSVSYLEFDRNNSKNCAKSFSCLFGTITVNALISIFFKLSGIFNIVITP